MSTALVEKTFQILEALAAYDDAVALKVLASETDIPKSTLHRLLQSLTELGYVAQDAKTGNYHLTMQLSHLGRSSRYEGLKESALPLLQRIHARFDETVNLGVLEGAHVYYLDVLETTQALRWIVNPGNRDSFYCTALGKSIVAFLPEERREMLIRNTKLVARTGNTIVSRRSLRADLEVIKERGVAIDDEENDLGVICFAAPIVQDDFPVAAVSVSLPKVRLNDDLRAKITSELRDAHRQALKRSLPAVAR